MKASESISVEVNYDRQREMPTGGTDPTCICLARLCNVIDLDYVGVPRAHQLSNIPVVGQQILLVCDRFVAVLNKALGIGERTLLSTQGLIALAELLGKFARLCLQDGSALWARLTVD